MLLIALLSVIMFSVSFAGRNLDLAGPALRLRPDELDGQQPILELCAGHRHAVGQHESALELPRGNPPVQIVAAAVLLLPARYGQLVLLDRDIDVVLAEA